MRTSSSRKPWRDPPPEHEPQTDRRVCDRPGCHEEGAYKAPRARDRLSEYYWFCLDHVREYNAAWNYYAGMAPDEIEAETRKDTTWQRPTWPLGAKGNGRRFRFTVHDPLGMMDDEGDAPHAAKPPASPEAEALKVLDLNGPVTFEMVKARYKELVKRHHPDANNGDKDAEERFKRINHAYNTLRTSMVAG